MSICSHFSSCPIYSITKKYDTIFNKKASITHTQFGRKKCLIQCTSKKTPAGQKNDLKAQKQGAPYDEPLALSKS